MKKKAHYDEAGNCLHKKSADDALYRLAWLQAEFGCRQTQAQLFGLQRFLHELDLWFFEYHPELYHELSEFVKQWCDSNPDELITSYLPPLEEEK